QLARAVASTSAARRFDAVYLDDSGFFVKRPGHFYLLGGEGFRSFLVTEHVHLLAIPEGVFELALGSANALDYALGFRAHSHVGMVVAAHGFGDHARESLWFRLCSHERREHECED